MSSNCHLILHQLRFFSQKMLLLEIWGYDPSICRSLGIEYVGRTKYNGIPVSLYELDLASDINVKQCFCRDEDTCPPKGTFDLFRCGGVSGTYFIRNSICNSILKWYCLQFNRFQCMHHCHIFIWPKSFCLASNLVSTQIKRNME